MPKYEGATPHQWVIVTEPIPETGLAVIVNITTLQPHSDKTTIIAAGEHPYVTHDSVAFYGDAQIVDVRLIEKGIKVANKYIWQLAPCDAKLLQKLQSGIIKSPHTKKKISDFCKERGKAQARRTTHN